MLSHSHDSQVGIGLKLAISGLKMAAFTGTGSQWRSLTGPEGLLLSMSAAVYLLLTVVKRSRAPDTTQGQGTTETVCTLKGTP